MLVFWRQGYETTTVHDLTEAMGITAPSLYSAFGDKESLYLEAVGHYRKRYGAGEHSRALLAGAPTAREGVRNLLFEAVHVMGDPDTPAGCMVVNSAINCSSSSSRVQAIVADCRAEAEADLRARIERGVRDGDVPATVDAAALAKFYATVIVGMSIQARDGMTCASLQAIIDAAMLAWPQA
ncbi:Transcriptional regulator, TetR family [plant metagenome]|uniref:Transcriptional regulator, TetR family n=1 Tax=plant metagenome TaxID=1297885 RepID=A0A484R7T6_9ZZZZ